MGIAMIALILVQRGSGAAAGSGFGGGASGTVFGSTGSSSFLTRTTAILAVLFFLVSLSMAVIAGRTAAPTDEVDIGLMGQVQSESDVPQVNVGPDDDVPNIQPGSPADIMSTDDVPQVELDSPVIDAEQPVEMTDEANVTPEIPASESGAADDDNS